MASLKDDNSYAVAEHRSRRLFRPQQKSAKVAANAVTGRSASRTELDLNAKNTLATSVCAFYARNCSVGETSNPVQISILGLWRAEQNAYS